MKKKLLTILLSIFMSLGCFVNVVHADISTINDVLNVTNSIPTMTGSSIPEGAWANGNGGYLVIEEDNISFTNAEYANCYPISIYLNVINNGNGTYVYTNGTVYVTFIISDNTLVNVILSGLTGTDEPLNGTYTAPVTIADILPTDFPTSTDNPCYNSEDEDSYMYKDNNKSELVFGNRTEDCYSISLSGLLVAGESTQGYSSDTKASYQYKNENITIQFNMKYDDDGSSYELENIVVLNSNITETNVKTGIYILPEPITISTVADVLATNTNFPKSTDSAWINANGIKSYANQTGLHFDTQGIETTLDVTKNTDGNYECSKGDRKFVFVMKNNVLDSIIVSGYVGGSSNLNGTYAMPVTVIFTTGVFGGTVPSQTIPKGTTATKPADPVKEGYVFKYWSLVDADEKFDFNTPINENAELKAIGRPIEIKDILPVDFPKVEQSGWVSGTKRLYLNVNSLYVNGPVLSVNYTPEKIQGTNDYKYDMVVGNITITFTFMMDNDDKLEKIKIEGDEGFNGEYVPYQYTNDPVTKQVGYSQDVEFVINATYTDPADTNVKVKIDDVELDKANYTVAHGSTIVKLKGDYIKNLPIGTHTITIEVTGYDPISQDFVIIPKTTPTPSPSPTPKPGFVAPKTGIN